MQLYGLSRLNLLGLQGQQLGQAKIVPAVTPTLMVEGCVRRAKVKAFTFQQGFLKSNFVATSRCRAVPRRVCGVCGLLKDFA